jgi:D-sedoheptulose 7-phosphate isomerase
MNKNMIKRISDEIETSVNAIIRCKELTNSIEEVVNIIVKALKNDNKIILFGNGGSAADAQHIAAEFVSRFKLERKSLPAISLTTDTSIITSIGNDYSFDKIFSRQCESLVSKNDIVIGISTSGNSKNIIEGLKEAKKKNAITIGLLGGNGGRIKEITDLEIIAPSDSTPKIQECHRMITHIICQLVEEELFKFENN